MANGIDGSTNVSLDTAIKVGAAVMAMVVFALTMKATQDSQNARIDSLTAEVKAVRAEQSAQRQDINEWKRATADLIFKPRNQVRP